MNSTTKEYGGLIINPSCSNYCVFCRKVPKATPSELKQQEINVAKNLVLLKRKGIRRIEISGSDPGEYDKITSLIKYIKTMGFDFVQLSTHGKKLANKLFLGKLIESGVDRLRIPIYGPQAKIHDSITRTKGSFNATTKGIKKLLKKAPKIQIQISSLIVQQNKDHLIEIVDLVNKLKITDFYFSVPCVKNDDYSYYLPLKELKPYLRAVDDYAAKNNCHINFMEIPFCVFGKISDSINNICLPPDHGEYCQPLKKIRTSIKDLPSYRIKKKINMCDNCKANDICDGFFLNDIKKYGIGNLKPII